MRSTHSVVTVPPASIDLVTLDIAKDELDITDVDSDYLLTRWISECSAAIAAYCKRTLAQQTVVETFNVFGGHPGGMLLSLKSYPIQVFGGHPRGMLLSLKSYPIQSVTITQDDEVLDPSSYQYDDRGLVARFGQGWAGCNLVVTYTGGYIVPGNVPLDLQTGCLTMLKYRFAARSRDPMLRAITIPGVIEKQFQMGALSLPPEVCECIDQYREYGI